MILREFSTEIKWKFAEEFYLIKFFVLIRGALTPPPKIEAPVTKIPLRIKVNKRQVEQL